MLIRSDKNQLSTQDKLKYIDLEAKPSKEVLESDFLKWLKDKSDIKKYEKVNVIKPGAIIIRLYRYQEVSKSLLGSDGNPMKLTKILPIAKVLHSGDSNRVKVGELLSCPDDLSVIETSPLWIQWNDRMTKEKPTPEGLIEPEMFVGKIFEWKKMSKFVLDKLNPTEDDEYTFIRQETEFSVKY